LNKHRRLIEWCRLLAGYSFVQAAAQGLGFLAGILVVRTLPTEDYACFVIVNTIGPVMNMLSDNGVTNSLSAIGGRDGQLGQYGNEPATTARIDQFSCCHTRACLDVEA